MDEPTAGLDPEERVRFRNLLCEVAQEKTVLLSTHIVGDIEATCENIAILDRGRLLFGGTVAALIAEAEGKVYSIELPQRELAGFRKRYEVTATVAGPRTATVRFVAPGGDPGIGRLESPRIEDAYLLCLSGAQSGERGERA